MLLIKILLATLAVVLILVFLYLLSDLILPLIVAKGAIDSDEVMHKDKVVYLHGNGVHVDIVFCRKDLPSSWHNDLCLSPEADFIALGWGDRGFYLNTPTWAELKFSVAFNAMVLKSPTVMHLTEHKKIGYDWRLVSLSADRFIRLINYVNRGFQLDDHGKYIHITDRGYTPADRFFEGAGYYHCTKTCNTWVNLGLKEAGCRTGIWSARQNGILRYFPELASTDQQLNPA